MVKSFFEKLNLEKLQTAYQFCVEYWDVNSNLLNENEVLISFGKELQLVFFCGKAPCQFVTLVLICYTLVKLKLFISL